MADHGGTGRWFTDHRFEDMGRCVDQQFEAAVPKVEEEVKKAVSYFNNEVIPRLRQNSSHALYAMAAQLHKLASHLEQSGGHPSS